jgi:hypothetical protein
MRALYQGVQLHKAREAESASRPADFACPLPSMFS